MKNKKLLIFVSGVIILFCIEIYLAYKINKLLENHSTITIHDTIYREHSDWELLKVALIWQESKGNPEARNGDAVGILQITPIYVAEANRIIKSNAYTLSDRESASESLKMFNVVQSFHNPEKDIKKAIKLHNPTAVDKYYQEVIDKYNMLKYLNDK